MRYLLIFFIIVMLTPLRVEGFSEGFKKQMTSLQEEVLLKGKKFGLKDAELCWQKFDREIVSLLAGMESPSEKKLNRETAWTMLSVVDHDELIELGAIEAKFHQMRGPGGMVWLVSFFNGMGILPTSTFHIYRKNEETGYRRISAFEEVSGPWDPEKVLWATLQIQQIQPGSQGKVPQFATYHMPPFKKSRSNRSQIVWEHDGSQLRPLLWIPEVDWHTVGGQEVSGRGTVFEISR